MEGAHHERVEDERHAKADQHRAERGHDPVYRGRVARPAEPEDADDEGWAGNHCAVQPLLGRRGATPLLEQCGVVAREKDVKRGAENSAEADEEEDEAGLLDGETPYLAKYDRERLEHCTTAIKSAVVQQDAEGTDGRAATDGTGECGAMMGWTNVRE
jgi:hypothetical protein